MTKVVLYRIALGLAVIQAAHSYILLTANIEDLRNIGQRLVDSPITGQVGTIMRRAYNVFSNNLDKPQPSLRAGDDDIVLAYKADETTSSQYTQDARRDNDQQGSEEQADTFSALRKSASAYLQKIKKIFDTA